MTTFGAPQGHGPGFDAEVLRHKKARQKRARTKEARQERGRDRRKTPRPY